MPDGKTLVLGEGVGTTDYAYVNILCYIDTAI